MRLLQLFLILFFFSCVSVYAQGFMKVNYTEFTGDNVEGKIFYKNINKAKKLFERGELQSEECLRLLLESNNFNSENAELNYNIGLCHLFYGKKDLAQAYFEKAKELKQNLNSEMYLYLGQACQYAGDYTNAILNYKIYTEILQHEGGKKNRTKLQEVLMYLEQSKNGQILSANQAEFEVEEMPYPINSDANDVLAIKDGSKLFFNSDRIIDGDKKDRKKEKDLRGFSVVLINGEWSNFSVLNDEKKSEELPLLVAKVDENQYLFYDKNIGLGDLIFMQKDEKYWTKEMDAFFMNKKKSNESSASFSSDGNLAVFVSDRGGGQGDIFYCQKDDDGEWSKPFKMNGNVNTNLDERDVFLSKDGNVIYFSSKGHNSIGGYDIFKSEKDDMGQWGKAQNMGIPINSSYDDCHYFPYEGDSFLFDSNRGKNGKFDIYTKKLIVETVIKEEVEEPVKQVEKLEEAIPVEKVDVLPTVIPFPIPVVKKVVTILTTYKIQIAASKKEIKESELKKLYRGKSEVTSSYDGEWYRYTIGDYESLEDAIYFRDRSGVERAFVVSFENDSRKKIITNYSLSRN